MKITMYELLGMVKDGKAPKKIKYKDFIYEYYDRETVIDYRCYDEKTELYGYLSSCVDYETFNILNKEVEILEEEKKEIKPLTKKDVEALGYACGEIQKCFTNGWDKALKNKPLEEEKKIPEKLNKQHFHKKQRQLANKINEIIDYFKSKGE